MTTLVQRLVFIGLAGILCVVVGLAIASGQCPWWLNVLTALLGLVAAGFATWVAVAPREQVRLLWKDTWKAPW